MATIKLKNMRSGESKVFPLAYFDFDAWTAYREANPSYLGSEAIGSIVVDNTGLPAAVIGSETKFYFDTVPEAYRFLIDTVKPQSSDNLLYIESGLLWREIFTPRLDQSPTTYSTPPADYNITGDYWVSSTPSGDVYTVSKAPAAFDIMRTWYSSTAATQLYRTQNEMTFGISAYAGGAYLTPQSGIVLVGGKQYDRGESLAWNRRNNIEWSPTMTGGLILDGDAGNYRSTAASFEISGDYADIICPTVWITTQCIYTVRDGQHLCGVASILWELDGFGEARPKEFAVNFIPLWAWGGISGSFVPDIPEVDEIPANTTTLTNGTWQIQQSAAGAASIPSVSPLAGIGLTESGMHILIADAAAIKKISDRAWSSISSTALESFTSGLMSCGFIPYSFLSDIIKPANAADRCVIGKVQIEMPAGDTHLWLANGQIFAQEFIASFGNSLREVYGNYLDFEPFTSVSLEIPFCGEVPIPASACIGGSIEVTMNCNITNGDVVATIECTSATHVLDGTKTPTEPLHRTFFATGNCFAQMPIVGTNSGLSQFLSGTLQAISGVVSLAAGNPAGVGSLATGALSMSQSGLQPVTGASPIGSPALIGNKKVILKIKRPAPNYVNANIGYQPYTSEKLMKLRDLKQDKDPSFHVNGKDLVVVREMVIEDPELSSGEKEMIAQLLQGGVFV